MSIVKALALVSALVAPAAFGADNDNLPLQVTVANGANKTVQISFKTVRINSSMCHLTNTSVTVAAPIGNDQLGIPTPPVGAIELTATLMPRQICLTAFGPHNGALTLNIGQSIPAVHNGYYALTINGDSYGIVEVRDGGSKLIDASELPQ